MTKALVVFYTNTKYSVHYHAYVNGDGNVYIRKRDTTRFGHDHVDVLRVEKGGLEFHGKPHVSTKIYREVTSSLLKAMQKILGASTTNTSVENIVSLYNESMMILRKSKKHVKK